MGDHLHVIIIGAGLAGPALAIALAKRSIQSTILERQPYSQNIGGVVMLAPNAIRVMDELLQMGDRLRAAGDTFEAIHLYTKGFGSTNVAKVGGFTVEDDGILGLSIRRSVLHQELIRSCEEMSDMITIRYSSELESIEEDSESCQAVLAGGSTVKGELSCPGTYRPRSRLKDSGSIIVGADGIRSKTRRHLLGGDDVTPSYCGYVSIGCVIPRVDACLPHNMVLPAFIYTPSGTFLIFAMDGGGDKIQWATSVVIPERDRRAGWDELKSSGQAIVMVQEEYGDVTAEPIRSLVSHMSNDNLRLWAPYTVPDISRWHSDRVCLIGDSIHAISPSVGQGAAQAFEDVGLLARLLTLPAAIDRGFPALFSQFEKIRRPRVRMIQQASIKAESSRGKAGWLIWTARTWVMWLGLKVFGTHGYVKGDFFRYDVMQENIEIMS